MTPTSEPRYCRILVAEENEQPGRWRWTVELRYGANSWDLQESGVKRNRRSALRKARRRGDYWLLTLNPYEGRIEETHAALKPVSPSWKPRPSPLQPTMIP